MNLYSGDLDVIEKEIKSLELKLKTEKDKDRIVGIVSSIEILVELYMDVNKKIPKNLDLYKKKNRKKIKISDKTQQKVANEFIKNFITNKKFHELFINDLYYSMSERENELFLIEKDTKLNYKEMYDIMTNYLHEEGLSHYFDNLLKNKRIFNGLSGENGYEGYAVHNTIDNTCAILVRDSSNSVNNMQTLIHELGHTIDFTNLSSSQGFITTNNYYLKSVYNEVISMLMEKNFLSYLIKNNICVEGACVGVEDYYLNIIEQLEGLLMLCFIDNELLINDRYKRLKSRQLIANVKKNNKEMIIAEEVIPSDLDLHDNLVYGYGGILAIYYNYLKENDLDKYNFYKNKFLDSRAHSFNIREFGYMFSSYDELEKDILEELSNDIKVKKKVYHEK